MSCLLSTVYVYCVMMACPKFISTVSVLAVLILSDAGIASDNCVNSFSDFKKATITDNSTNVDALVHAFYEANNVFPLSSVQVVYHMNSSNGTDIIISTNPNCPPGKEMWLWIPSPVFIFINPTRLNSYVLFTLNYFNPWTPRLVSITVPSICNKNLSYFNFLNDLTMRVSFL